MSAFEITYGCDNCGDRWTKDHDERTAVTEYDEEVVVADMDGQLGDSYRVTCPTCELIEDVTVEHRSPVDGTMMETDT